MTAILQGSGAFYLTMLCIVAFLTLVFMAGRWSKP